MPPFAYSELEKCAAREAAMRRNVYKRHGKNTSADLREIEMMEAIAEHFKALAEAPTWPDTLAEKYGGERRISDR